MKSYKTIIILVSLSLLAILQSCQENSSTDINQSDDKIDISNKEKLFIAEELVAEKTDIRRGQHITISIKVTGDKVDYYWKASEGELIGNGSSIVYAAAYCCAGINTITCTVTDNKGNKEYKEIKINVH